MAKRAVGLDEWMAMGQRIHGELQDRKEQLQAELEEVERQLSQFPGDLSAQSGLNALVRDPAFAGDFLEEFQDRLVFGLDYCSVENDFNHLEWLQRARDDGRISSQAYAKITGDNISGLLNRSRR